MMKEIIILLSNNMLFKALLICVSLDSILGALRAIKEHKFNSCVGIDVVKTLERVYKNYYYIIRGVI